VKKRLALWLFGLYRPSTRRRYRDDFEGLIDDLIDSGEAPWHLCAEIAAAGCVDRLHGRRPAGIVVVAGMLVLAAALTLTISVGPGPRPTSTGSSATAPISAQFNAVGIPVGPQPSAASCPNPPALSSQLPPGAVISPPTLTPPDTASLTVAGHTYDAAGTCQYTVTYNSP